MFSQLSSISLCVIASAVQAQKAEDIAFSEEIVKKLDKLRFVDSDTI